MNDSRLTGLARIPRGVWALGFVSMCMDLSSELIHSLLPLYMAIGLGASTLTIGLVEGIDQGATAAVAGASQNRHCRGIGDNTGRGKILGPANCHAIRQMCSSVLP